MPEGARLTAPARMAHITKQSMSALVDHLEATGYVERGRAYGRAVRAFARSVEDDWAQRIGAQRLEELRRALELLRESLLADDR
jgi:DNA-binding MarR family transcriptional regulator